MTGRPAEALASYEQARAIRERLARENPSVTEFQSDLAGSHNNIGVLQDETGRPAEALASYEQARAIRERLVRENPSVTEFQSDLATSHNNIGILQGATGSAGGGAGVVRAGPRDPGAAGARASRVARLRQRPGRDLEQHGHDRPGPAAIRQGPGQAHAGHRMAAEGPGGQPQSPHLPAVPGQPPDQPDPSRPKAWAAPTRPPKPSASWTSFATRTRGSWPSMPGWPPCSRVRHPRTRPSESSLPIVPMRRSLHAASARLFAEALANDPKLADDRQAQHRYNAACAAALAASGQGKDDPPPDDAAKAKLRQQAREWLQAELAAWAKVLDTGPADMKAKIAPTLQHWKADTDLAGIRDEKELAKLPEEERAAFKQLWNDVDQLLIKTAARK